MSHIADIQGDDHEGYQKDELHLIIHQLLMGEAYEAASNSATCPVCSRIFVSYPGKVKWSEYKK